MLRRRFLAVLAGASCLPLFARAQTEKSPRIGVLMLGNPDPAQFLAAFRQGLRDLGYVEGRNIDLETRSANGAPERLPSLARELVDMKVDAIVGYQSPCVAAARKATSQIPIIMSPAADPLGTGFVASIARPGGNVTGISSGTAEYAGKNLDLIRAALPAVRKVGVFGNSIDPFHTSFLNSVTAAAKKLGLEIRPVTVNGPDEFAKALEEMAAGGVGAVVVQPSFPRALTAEMALKRHMPLFAPGEEFTAAGGLMSYSSDSASIYRDAASFVDKIVKGQKPADLPVQFPTKFRFVVNLKTARALGLTLPPSLLAQADDVIE